MSRFTLVFVLLLLSLSELSLAQNDNIRLSGMVLQLDNIIPVPSTNIYVKGSNHGTRADTRGLFSIDVNKNDTIIFSAIGRKTMLYIVPDTLTSKSYSIIQRLPKDTVQLKTLEITSWPSLEKFNETFTEEYGYSTDLGKATHNANPNLNVIDYSIDLDLRDYGEAHIGNYTYVYENANIPVKDVLNPKRWNKLVNDWKNGKHR